MELDSSNRRTVERVSRQAVIEPMAAGVDDGPRGRCDDELQLRAMPALGERESIRLIHVLGPTRCCEAAVAAEFTDVSR